MTMAHGIRHEITVSSSQTTVQLKIASSFARIVGGSITVRRLKSGGGRKP